MVKYFTYSLILIFLSAECYAEKKDFRNVSWGMSRLEVMANEEIAPDSFELMYLFYQPQVEGRKFNLIYEFTGNKLTDAEYIFIAYNRNDYLWVKSLIEIKYGRPFSSFDGGAGNYKFRWRTPRTDIIMRPGRDRECLVEYSGKKFQYLKKEKDKKIQLTKINAVKSSF